MPNEPNPASSFQVRRYLTNVMWSWAGVAVTLLVGFFVSPFVIHHVGDAGFGVWSLTLSLVEYYWLIDVGFRSATLKYAAQYRAEGNAAKLNELLSTGLVYSVASGAVIFGGSYVLAPLLGRLLHIQQPAFVPLVRIVGLSWTLGLVFGRYTAFLEGFQRFDITSRLWILTTALRTGAIILLLHHGFGLVSMAWALAATQMLGYVLGYIYLRREFPEYDARWMAATVSMMKQMAGYGVHSLTIIVSNRLLNQSAPFLIAYFLPVRFVSYYSVPVRLLDSAMEGIGRIGMVTAPNAAELEVKTGREGLTRLGIYTNRYCLAIYLPVTVLFSLYGREFMSLWIRPEFARESAILLPILLAGTTVYAGQFNSVSILTGLGRHKVYARTLLAEAALSVTAMALTIPRFGIIAAGVTAAVLMAINRGLICSVLAARELRVPPLKYLSQIFALPLAAAAAAAAISVWVKHNWLAGRTWRELIAAVALFCAIYGALAVRFCLAPEHRAKVAGRISRLIRPYIHSA